MSGHVAHKEGVTNVYTVLAGKLEKKETTGNTRSKRDSIKHIILVRVWGNLPIPAAARSKAWVCGRSLAGIVGSNPTGGMDVCLVSVVCCQVEVSATRWSLVQGRPTECGVSACHREASTMRRSRPPRAVEPLGEKIGNLEWIHLAQDRVLWKTVVICN
jgi:hypothetical protein